MSNITFGTLEPNGELRNVRILSSKDIKNCPSYIFWPEHYRADGSCRHNEVICETDGCTNPKWDEEIFCEAHCA